MRIYRTTLKRMADGEHLGFAYSRSRRDAGKRCRVALADGCRPEVEPLDFDCTKDGVIELLSRVADHADNG